MDELYSFCPAEGRAKKEGKEREGKERKGQSPLPNKDSVENSLTCCWLPAKKNGHAVA